MRVVASQFQRLLADERTSFLDVHRHPQSRFLPRRAPYSVVSGVTTAFTDSAAPAAPPAEKPAPFWGVSPTFPHAQ